MCRSDAASKHESSLDRQIRSGVYLTCDGSDDPQGKLEMSDFIVLEKLRKQNVIKSYR